ncbi:MAG: hypothetical protein M9949_04615 [Candidatus Kapabacteria bacterium]|nr:hypothetical protein [Candidatus Kapabacteria bacterium]
MKLANHLNVNKHEIRNALGHILTTPPSSPGESQFYYNSVSKQYEYFNGTIWLAFGINNHELLSNIGTNSHADIDNHIANTSNPHSVDKTQVGLPNVDNVQQIPMSWIDTDPTLSADSDTAVASQKAAKAYVDQLMRGRKWKDDVRVFIPFENVFSGLVVRDGVSLADGDRVNVANADVDGKEGIWIVKTTAWVRAEDANTSAEVEGMAFKVAEGTTYADTMWLLATDNVVLDTTKLTFIQVAGAGLYSAGSGINLIGNAFSASNLIPRIHAANIGDGSAVNFVITHNFGTRDIAVRVRNSSSPYEFIEPDYEATSTNTVTIKFAVAPTLNQYRAIITGAVA